MAQVLSRETLLDESGAYIQTTKIESFDEVTPSSGVKSARALKQDGKWQFEEEEVLSAGDWMYSFESRCTQEPVETHPYFKNTLNSDELLNYRLWQQGNGPSGWSPETSSDEYLKQLYKNYHKRGITSYLAASITMRMTNFEDAPPVLNGIGKIDASVSCPSIGIACQWLLVGATGQQETSSGTLRWRNTYEFIGTPYPGTWDTHLYT